MFLRKKQLEILAVKESFPSPPSRALSSRKVARQHDAAQPCRRKTLTYIYLIRFFFPFLKSMVKTEFPPLGTTGLVNITARIKTAPVNRRSQRTISALCQIQNSVILFDLVLATIRHVASQILSFSVVFNLMRFQTLSSQQSLQFMQL